MAATPQYFINKDNAKELARKAHASRAYNLTVLPKSPPLQPSQQLATDDPIANGIIRAIKRTLVDLDKSKLAKERAMLAQALRNLRETYHLVTGQPRPGMIKHSARPARPSYPQPEVLPEPMPDQPSTVPFRPNAGVGSVAVSTCNPPSPIPQQTQPSPTIPDQSHNA